MNNDTATIISTAIAVVSAGVAFWTMGRLYFKVRNSKNFTLTKSNGESITIPREYNRENSKKLLEFIK